MNDVGNSLREADPLASEQGLSMEAAHRIRRVVVAEAVRMSEHAAWWPQPLFVASTIALTVLAGAALGRRLPPPRDSSSRGGSMSSQFNDVVPESPARRQLQFATPGGTRIIWVFDPNFTL